MAKCLYIANYNKHTCYTTKQFKFIKVFYKQLLNTSNGKIDFHENKQLNKLPENFTSFNGNVFRFLSKRLKKVGTFVVLDTNKAEYIKKYITIFVTIKCCN